MNFKRAGARSASLPLYPRVWSRISAPYIFNGQISPVLSESKSAPLRCPPPPAFTFGVLGPHGTTVLHGQAHGVLSVLSQPRSTALAPSWLPHRLRVQTCPPPSERASNCVRPSSPVIARSRPNTSGCVYGAKTGSDATVWSVSVPVSVSACVCVSTCVCCVYTRVCVGLQVLSQMCLKQRDGCGPHSDCRVYTLPQKH